MNLRVRADIFRKRTKIAVVGGLLSMLAILPAPAAPAGVIEVDVKLVIATDVSRSMTDDEAKLQREGIASVFTEPEVIKAIQSGQIGMIAVAMLDWSSPRNNKIVLDWTLIKDRASAAAFAVKIRNLPRTQGERTSISGALEQSFQMLSDSDGAIVAERKVVDVSGDGPNNDGVSLEHVHEVTQNNGVIVNGLPIMDESSEGYFPDLDKFYDACVVAGKGAFLIAVHRYRDFGAAMRRKLVLEVSQNEDQIKQALMELNAGGFLKRIATNDRALSIQFPSLRPPKTYPGGCDKYGGWGWGGY